MMAPSFADDWHQHKDDLFVWRRFWALWELRRKWNWAQWFFLQVDRAEGEIVQTECWSLLPGPGYMKLSLWIALLKCVHEGMTERLDSFETPPSERVSPSSVLPPIPNSIREFPAVKGTPFRDFRNAVFHCQWSPTLAKFKLDEDTTNALEKLHTETGDWIKAEFRSTFPVFLSRYGHPGRWVIDEHGNESVPGLFF